MVLPLNDARITSPYGVVRSDGKVHTGIDFISTSGDREVKAIKDSLIRGIFYDENGYGNYISIQHADGTRALYCHLEEVKCKKGDFVQAGTVIGIEGKTGNSTGVHLHLEMRDAPYMTRNHINVADYLGISNIRGDVNFKLTREEKIKLIKEKVGYDDNTCKYMFNFYKYGDEALEKLVKALRENE